MDGADNSMGKDTALASVRPNIYVDVHHESSKTNPPSRENSHNQSVLFQAESSALSPLSLSAADTPELLSKSPAPKNSYVTMSGQVRLLPSGIAERQQRQQQQQEQQQHDHFTTAGISGGTNCFVGENFQHSPTGSNDASGSNRSKSSSVKPASIVHQRLDSGASVSSLNSSFEALRNLSNMNTIIHHPLSAGFLFRFCESQYCAENIKFIIEVDKFRDYLFQDRAAFSSKLWRDIDLELQMSSSREQSKPGTPTRRNSSKSEIASTASDIPASTAAGASAAGAAATAGGRTTSKTMKVSKAKTTVTAQMLDELVESDDLLVPPTTWRSIKIDRKVVASKVRYIWQQFLSDAAEEQICIPGTVLDKTAQRLQHIYLYGPEVFQECLLDPIKTIQRDIKPRFMVSSVMRELKLRVEDLMELPCASALRLAAPNATAHLKYTALQLKDPAFGFTLEDMRTDRLCYSKFMRYLNRIVCSENLRFLRAVDIFKSKLCCGEDSNALNTTSSAGTASSLTSAAVLHLPPINESKSLAPGEMNDGSKSTPPQQEAVSMAWLILMYFISPTSSYEISISHSERREIMRHMASPTLDMFDNIAHYTQNMLKVHFDNFKNTSDYKELPVLLAAELPQRKKDSAAAVTKDRKKKKQEALSVEKPPGCFGFLVS